MPNEPSTEQMVATEIATDATEPPIKFTAKLKAAIAEMPARQVFKLTLLGMALLVWYPIYSRLDPFSRWAAYDVFRIAPGTHLGTPCPFSF
jgi:hypothetical protein